MTNTPPPPPPSSPSSWAVPRMARTHAALIWSRRATVTILEHDKQIRWFNHDEYIHIHTQTNTPVCRLGRRSCFKLFRRGEGLAWNLIRMTVEKNVSKLDSFKTVLIYHIVRYYNRASLAMYIHTDAARLMYATRTLQWESNTIWPTGLDNLKYYLMWWRRKKKTRPTRAACSLNKTRRHFAFSLCTHSDWLYRIFWETHFADGDHVVRF